MTAVGRGVRPRCRSAREVDTWVGRPRPLRPTRSPTHEAEGGAMITIENLTKRYGGFTAVDDISFQVRPGSVVGFLGPNGAGKSTAMRMMTGLTPPTAGRATILGQTYRELHNPGRQV